MHTVQKDLAGLKKYSYLLAQLISRDFKVKYKRSALGVAWSLLYPLLTTGVLALVFANIFRFTQPGVSFLAYLMTGLTYFNYFSEASNLSMSSVVANFNLLNKVYIPKYIFPLSKCLFVGINFLLTPAAVCGAHLHRNRHHMAPCASAVFVFVPVPVHSGHELSCGDDCCVYARHVLYLRRCAHADDVCHAHHV